MDRLRFFGVLSLALALGCATSTPKEPALEGTRSERIAWILNEVDALQSMVAELVQRVNELGPATDEIAREAGGAPATALYEIVGLEIPAIAEKRRYDVIGMLYEKLGPSTIESIEYRGADGLERYQAPFRGGFDAIPTPVLLAAANVVTPDKRGLEWDLVAPAKAAPAWRVTFWYELDERLVIAAAESTSLPSVAAGPESSAERMSARYGVGPIENAGRSWAPAELQILDSALASLSEGERARIRDLPFRRVRKVSMPPPNLPRGTKAGGIYRTSENAEHWIEIADAAFTTDDMLFVGEPSQPHRPSERAMLHEVGHAIAMRATFETIQLAHRIRSKQIRVGREVNRFVGTPAKPHENMSFNHITEAFAEMNGTLTPLLPALANVKRSPVLTAYAELPGIRRKPTRYGQTALEESFAESFSLYHLDREALARVSPEAVAFFTAQRHLPRE